MKSKKVWAVGAAAAIAAAIVAFFLLRHPATAGMELLDLLPADADVYAVADLPGLARNAAIQKLASNPPGFARDADYERFVQATGFRYERDLKQLALARLGQDWVGAARVNVDRPRVMQYMESQGAEKKDELGKTVFSFGHVRRLRLVLLDERSTDAQVAFTVGGDDARIQQAIERRLGRLKDSAAAEIQRAGHLAHIPQASKLWLVGRPEKLWGDGTDPQFGSFGLNKSFFRGSKMLYVSLESAPNQLNLRAEDYCDSDGSAQRISGSLQGLLTLVRAMPAGKGDPKGAKVDPKAVLAGVSVEQQEQSVVVRWKLDNDALSFLEAASR
jgi:hypothetical protein